MQLILRVTSDSLKARHLCDFVFISSSLLLHPFTHQTQLPRNRKAYVSSAQDTEATRKSDKLKGQNSKTFRAEQCDSTQTFQFLVLPRVSDIQRVPGFLFLLSSENSLKREKKTALQPPSSVFSVSVPVSLLHLLLFSLLYLFRTRLSGLSLLFSFSRLARASRKRCSVLTWTAGATTTRAMCSHRLRALLWVGGGDNMGWEQDVNIDDGRGGDVMDQLVLLFTACLCLYTSKVSHGVRVS